MRSPLFALKPMGAAGAILRNTGSQATGHVVGVLLALAASVILTRHLGPDGYGQYVFALTYVGFFAPLVRMGIDGIVVRELATGDVREAHLLDAALGLKLVLASIAFAVALAALPLVAAPALRPAALVATPTLLVGALLGRGLVFQARLAMHFRSMADVVGHAALLAGVALLGILGAGLLPMVGAYTMANVATATAVVFLSRKLLPLGIAVDTTLWRRLLVDAAPLGAAEFLHQLYYRADVMILAHYWDSAAVGTYSVANGMFDQAILLFSFLAGSLFPVMARRQGAGMGALVTFVRNSLLLAAAAAAAAAIATLLLAAPVITLLYGQAYEPSAALLKVLSLAFPFKFVWYVMAFALTTVNRQRSLVVATAAGLVVNVALNLALVPTTGYHGSAWATVATEMLVIAVVGAGLRRALR